MTRRYTCCRSGTRGVSRHGQTRSCSTSFIAPRGMAASQLADCCDGPRTDSVGRLTPRLPRSGFSEFPRSYEYVDGFLRHCACAHRAHASHPRSPASIGSARTQPPSSITDPRRAHRRTHVQAEGTGDVRTDPSEHYEQSPREARRRGSGLRSRRRPVEWAQAHRLRCLGTACGRAQRHVPGPAVLRQRRAPELRAAASREWGGKRARGDSGRHPRSVQPPRGRILIDLHGHRAAGHRPAVRRPWRTPPTPTRPGWTASLRLSNYRGPCATATDKGPSWTPLLTPPLAALIRRSTR